jgi:hypothetical protein
MYAQQQGAFDTKSQYTAQSGQYGYGGGGASGQYGMQYGSPGGSQQYGSSQKMMIPGNPVLQAEMSAQNPMFASPGNSTASSKPGYVPGNRSSIEV